MIGALAFRLGPAGHALAAAAGEAGEHAATFLGLPLWIWQLANLILFLGLLWYFVARPMAALFRKRQVEIEERLRDAKARREEAARLESDIREKMAHFDAEMAEIRERGASEGHSERQALLERATQEAERVRRESREEIQRRLDAAKDELRRTAAELTAASARALVVREITDEDRKRLLEESVEQMEQAR